MTDESLYDSVKDQYYCDIDCLEDYLSNNIEEAVKVYMRFRIE